MKRFIEIKLLQYVNTAFLEKHSFGKPEIKTQTTEIVSQQIIPVENIKKVLNLEPTELLIYNDNERKFEYIKVKNTYDEIKSKMSDMLC